MNGPATTLVLGGARSGKSRLGERIAHASGRQRVYIATAQPLDDEMTERIARHRADRGDGWTTIDAPIDLAATLRAEAAASRILLVDCLTLWLTNVMLEERDVEADCAELADAVKTIPTSLILISNETGLGIVPDNALARRFRDAQGRLNQMIAAVAPRVVFVAAGLPLALKGDALDLS